MSKNMAGLIILVFLLAVVSIGSSSAQQIDGPMVLRRMLEAEGKVAFTAHQVTTIARGPSITSEQIIFRAGFKGTRTEYLQPPALKGEVMADDGRVLAHYIPREKVLRMLPSRLVDLRKRTDEVERLFRRGNLVTEMVGRDKIAGRDAYVIEVKPRLRRGGPTRKFWVDTEKWVKLKTEDITPSGTVASMSYYTRIDFVDTIPVTKFRFEPPPGTRIERESPPAPRMSVEEAQKQVRFRILEPTYLPPGFRPVGATVAPFRRGKVVALRYTDGVSSLSLFQVPGHMLGRGFLERLHEGPVQPDKGVYSWKVGPLNLTIVSQLPMDQVRKIADSVR